MLFRILYKVHICLLSLSHTSEEVNYEPEGSHLWWGSGVYARAAHEAELWSQAEGSQCPEWCRTQGLHMEFLLVLRDST